MTSSNQFKSFELSRDEVRVLFALEHWLVRLDIEETSDQKAEITKQAWFKKWEESLFKRTFFGLLGEAPPKSEEELIQKAENVSDLRKRALIFCEALIFTPYFNLQCREIGKIDSSEKERKIWKDTLCLIASKCEVEPSLLEHWEATYFKALKGIDGRSDLLKKASLIALASVAIAATGGAAAPVLGSFIGGLMGLSGAAATSAGLAFLGGGAIAAGGYGMAGGTLALIGGGAILGGLGVAGLSVNTGLIFEQNKIVLSQLAKLEASLLVIFSKYSDYPKLLSEAIDALMLTVSNLKKEISEKNIDPQKLKKLIKVEQYFRIAAKRLSDIKLNL